jgi:hypothetical protein
VRVGPLSDLLNQLHLGAIGCGDPAHMSAIVEALFEDVRPVLFQVCHRTGVVVSLDRDVLDADVLFVVLLGIDRCHVKLHAVQV